MRLIKYLLLLSLICLELYLVKSQQTVDSNNNVINVEDVLRKIANGGEEFSLELFKRISEAVAPAAYDFMISPFSVWSLLVLIAEGAKGNTLEQLRKTLRLESDMASVREGYKHIQKSLNVNTSTIEVSAVSALFSDKNRPADPDYENVIERIYNTQLIPVDFHKLSEATKTINDYVIEVTRGLLGEIVQNNDLRDAQMILMSAIFFKGQWKYPFNTTLTERDIFYNEEGVIQGTVNMMFNRGPFPYAPITEIDSHVLELPYGKEDRLSMIIFLPRRGATLTSVIDKVSKYGLKRIYSQLKKVTQDFEDDEVEVYLPRFSVTSDFILNVVLQQMGIVDVFDSTKSDLSKISSHPMYLSRIFHKTKIEVNEEGTVASAVTGGVLANKATPPRFHVNRPFAYIILEKTTSTLIFCGVVRNPSRFKI